jgi:hypothetical protein
LSKIRAVGCPAGVEKIISPFKAREFTEPNDGELFESFDLYNLDFLELEHKN